MIAIYQYNFRGCPTKLLLLGLTLQNKEENTMSENEIIQIIAFSGSTSSWSDWEVKFLARGQRKGFARILRGTAKAPPTLQVINKKTPAGKIEK